MDQQNGKRRIKIKVKDPLHPTSEPEPENQDDSSASQADQAQPTGKPEVTANGQEGRAEASPAADASAANAKPETGAEKDLDVFQESAPAGSETAKEAEKSEDNATFVDLAARLGDCLLYTSPSPRDRG